MKRSTRLLLKSLLLGGVVFSLAGPANAGTVNVNSQLGPDVKEERIIAPDVKRAISRGIVSNDRDIINFIGIFAHNLNIFGFDQVVEAKVISFNNADPWLMFRYDLINGTNQELFYALDMRLETEVTSGPTFKDAFLNLELIDSNNDGFVQSRSTFAGYNVVDDPGGQNINGQEGLARADLFNNIYTGEIVHSLFDTSGNGPNSDLVDGTDGYNFLNFFINGYISPGDSLTLTSLGCYGAEATYCPPRFEIPADLGSPDINPVPVPAAIWLFGTALIGLVGFSKRNKAA